MQENLYTPDCIRTHSGLYFNIVEPRPEQIDIKDIAWALSRQCRFGAHLPVFYTVAQHSIQTCLNSRDAHKLQALMHDASEAYLLDIPSPVKKQLTGYKEMEDKIMRVIAAKFGFEWPMNELTKQLDTQELEHEWGTYMLKEKPGYVMLCQWKKPVSNSLFISTPTYV